MTFSSIESGSQALPIYDGLQAYESDDTRQLMSKQYSALADTIYVPSMPDEYGGIPALGSFTVALLCDKQVAPSEVDKQIGRTPGSATSMTRLSDWLFTNGCTIEAVRTPDPMDGVLTELADGKIDVDAFVDAFRAYNPTNSLNIAEYKKYVEDTLLPDHRHARATAAGRIQEGVLIKRTEPVTEATIASLLTGGRVVCGDLLNSDGTVTAAALVRPDDALPSLVYIPRVTPEKSLFGYANKGMIERMIDGGFVNSVSKPA